MFTDCLDQHLKRNQLLKRGDALLPPPVARVKAPRAQQHGILNTRKPRGVLARNGAQARAARRGQKVGAVLAVVGVQGGGRLGVGVYQREELLGVLEELGVCLGELGVVLARLAVLVVAHGDPFGLRGG